MSKMSREAQTSLSPPPPPCPSLRSTARGQSGNHHLLPSAVGQPQTVVAEHVSCRSSAWPWPPVHLRQQHRPSADLGQPRLISLVTDGCLQFPGKPGYAVSPSHTSPRWLHVPMWVASRLSQASRPSLTSARTTGPASTSPSTSICWESKKSYHHGPLSRIWAAAAKWHKQTSTAYHGE